MGLENIATDVDPARYRDGLARYREAVGGLEVGDQADANRLETQFECLRDWSLCHDLAAVKSWFLDQRANCGFHVEDIPITECQGWHTDPETGWIKKDDGEFFVVQGVRVRQSDDREVGAGGWDQPILTQVGYDGGIVGTLRQRIHGVPHYLIEAKAEPGNYELVQMSSTLQATFSNLRRAHGGKKPRFAEYFETPEETGASVIFKQWLSEDGGRLHNKRNMGMMVEVPEGTITDPGPTFIWMSLWQIKACLQENAWVNPHIRGVVSAL